MTPPNPDPLIAFLTAQLEKHQAEAGTLYIVGTPIGNLGDLSPRAIAILATVDAIAAEDTRHSGQLMHLLGLRQPLISYHEHNRLERIPELVARLQDGASLALVSDAGMPAISDPGQELVAACRAADLPVAVIPGPSAVIAALAASGLDSTHFRFLGFLPVKGRERSEAIERIRQTADTTLLYEAPHRLLRTLQDLASAGFGTSPAVVMRELTKRFEACHRGTIDTLITEFEAEPPRGEIVLLLSPTPPPTTQDESADADWWLRQIDEGLAAGQRPTALVKALLAEERPVGVPELSRNELYALVLERRSS